MILKILFLSTLVFQKITYFLFSFTWKKAQKQKNNSETTLCLLSNIPVGTFRDFPTELKQLQKPSPTRPPIEDIKKIMTLLALHGSITGVIARGGRQPLPISKSESDRSIN